jgi:hypothetical protein
MSGFAGGVTVGLLFWLAVYIAVRFQEHWR